MYEIVIISKAELEQANNDIKKILAERPAGKDICCDKRALEEWANYLQYQYGETAKVIIREAPVKVRTIPYKPICKIHMKGGE